ncbi:MAG TPA: hypothetical protein VJR26_13045 [Candidatus Acidoferrales bacterium]|nr:hypothetical protein [Candidatus Acidoferrales bacterium]
MNNSIGRRWSRVFLQPLWIAATVSAIAACAAAGHPPSLRSLFMETASKSSDASAFEPDKGTFRIAVNGQTVGKEEFEIVPEGGNWIARGSTSLQSDKGATRVTGVLTLRPDGTPVHYEWSTQGPKKASARVDFNGTTATSELHVGAARPFTQQFTFASSRIAVLDNNLYGQFAVLAHLYDWNKKGAQTFPVLVPQELTPGTATLESMGKQEVDGKKLEELRVTTEDNEIDLFLDGSRLVRITVPSASAEIVRE